MVSTAVVEIDDDIDPDTLTSSQIGDLLYGQISDVTILSASCLGEANP